MYLNRSVALTRDLELDPFPPFMDDNIPFLDRYDGTGHLVWLVLRGVWERKEVV